MSRHEVGGQPEQNVVQLDKLWQPRANNSDLQPLPNRWTGLYMATRTEDLAFSGSLNELKGLFHEAGLPLGRWDVCPGADVKGTVSEQALCQHRMHHSQTNLKEIN